MIGSPILNKFRLHWLRDKAKYAPEIERPVGMIALKYYNLGAADLLPRLLSVLPAAIHGQLTGMLLEYIVENQEAFEPGLSAKAAAAGARAQRPQEPEPA